MKSLSPNAARYIPKCWGKSVKGKPNLKFVRIIKNASFDQSFLCIWSKFFLKTLRWLCFDPCSDYLLVSSATLSCKTRNISTLSMLVYFELNSLCLILKVCKALVCSGKLRRDWRSFIIKKSPAETDYYSLNILQTKFRLVTSYFESSGSRSN